MTEKERWGRGKRDCRRGRRRNALDGMDSSQWLFFFRDCRPRWMVVMSVRIKFMPLKIVDMISIPILRRVYLHRSNLNVFV